MMANWRRDEARRKATEKLQGAEERRAADRWAKRQAALRRWLAQQEQAFKASGCETREEFDELQRAKNAIRAQEQAERDERQRALVEPFVELEHGMPDAMAVAFALSQRHAGGAAVSLADLLVEAGLADESNAARRSKSPHVGVALAGHLRELHWRKRRMAYGMEWVPPGRKERE